MKFDRYGEYLGYGILKSDTELVSEGKKSSVVGVNDCGKVCTESVLFLCEKNEDKEIVIKEMDDIPTSNAIEISEGSFISMVSSKKSGKMLVAVRVEDMDIDEENGELCISGEVGGVKLRASASKYNIDEIRDAEIAIIFGENPLIKKELRSINMIDVDIYLM